MLIGRVAGTVVSTNRSEQLNGYALRIVIPVDIAAMKDSGDPIVCFDTVGAGENELVMCVAGSSSRQTGITKDSPADLSIVAIIDSLDYENARIYEKAGSR